MDGRYRSKLDALAPLVSEFGLLRYRVTVECAWYAHLAGAPQVAELPALSAPQAAALAAIADEFSLTDAQRIKAIEATTNHDVKAVEYFVKERLSEIEGLAPFIEFVHFACTSEDINNLAYGLMLHDARQHIATQMASVIEQIDILAQSSADLAMLSRTHGQAASPTTLGKELANFAHRLARQLRQFRAVNLLGKMNGAVGNYNAHVVAYPQIDWPALSSEFIEALGLDVNPYTTQIEPHDYIAELFHALARFNRVLLDFDRDIWSYISINYFTQARIEGETGSSTMPHKINPIDFENSEGNLGVADALLEHMASKLQVSRWQRDLSDSTVLRNIGSALGHCSVAYQATLKGMGRLQVNAEVIAADLDSSWEVLTEAVQTVMRKHGVSEPYEQLKRVTRGKRMDRTLFLEVLDSVELPDEARRTLMQLTPAQYIGIADTLAQTPAAVPDQPKDS
ncbi:MAG: adenylosuccinate lyase [Gammaproteobacteria bacterium]|nr:adenylosuccinate lyase [Gammaproteobacteria bacterium]